MNQTPLIDIRNVTKDFPLAGGKVSVLKGVSLQAMRGEFLAIVGPSGNGKSTLLNMITGIDHPTSGEVYVNGTPIHAMNEEQLSIWRGTQVGIVFQFFQLLPSLSLVQNIILPMDFAKSLPKKQRRNAPCTCWNWSAWQIRRRNCLATSQADSSNAPPSRARSPTTRRSSSQMSRQATSTRKPAMMCSIFSAISWIRARRS
jgi:ABC-type methionine transport system ATPase subunit